MSRRWLSYLPARIFSAAFATGNTLNFTPAGVANFKPLFSIVFSATSSSTTIIREIFNFVVQRLATCPWIKRPSIRLAIIVIVYPPLLV